MEAIETLTFNPDYSTFREACITSGARTVAVLVFHRRSRAVREFVGITARGCIERRITPNDGRMAYSSTVSLDVQEVMRPGNVTPKAGIHEAVAVA